MIFGNLFKSNKADSAPGYAGLTDSHSHILPGVDDGIRSMEDSLAVLAEYEKLGFKKVWLTPHIMEDVPNTTDALKKRFAELKAEYKGCLTLDLASENMLDNLFLERLEKLDFLPIYDNHLLVETSYFSPPMNLTDVLKQIMSAGFIPLLAHPERYVYMDMDMYRELHDMGVKLQLNVLSLSGFYGKSAKEKSHKLAKHGMYSVFGSDLHRLSQTEHLRHVSAELNKYIKQGNLEGI